MYNCIIRRIIDIKNFYEWVYHDNGLFMERKKRKYESLLNKISNVELRKNNRRILTKKDINNIIFDRQHGYGFLRLSKKYNVSISTIKHHIKKEILQM